MEILILIGIFAFVVAILFRSNEALDRVGEVEKEVKTLESEVKQEESPKTDPVTAMFDGPKKESAAEPAVPQVEQPVAQEAEIKQPVPAQTYEPAFVPMSEAPAAEPLQTVPAGAPVAEPAAEVTAAEPAPVQSSDQAFPNTGDVRMN